MTTTDTTFPAQTQKPDEDLGTKITRVFEAQQANKDQIALTTASQRIEKLRALKAAIMANRQRIRDALHADFRKPPAEVDLTEIFAVTTEIKHTVRHLKRWMKPQRVRPTLAMLTTSSQIRYQPRGNVLVISPWNFPFNLTLGPIVSAMAAGNCIIAKPSEFTVTTSLLMKEIIEDLFPENEIALFLGEKDVAQHLLDMPFDHIFFTGSPYVGKVVMAAAAKHLASVTLELGGKSPVIVDERADIRDAAQKIAWGKFMNNGQTCLAPDYLYVHESCKDDFIESFNEALEEMYGQDERKRESSADYARIISVSHHNRLKRLLGDAVQDGAKINTGGETGDSSRYFAPTLIEGVQMDSALMREEIFGPILPLLTFKSLEEVVGVIKSKDKPLALYLFSKNKHNIDFILKSTSSGGVCINDVVIHYLHLNLPFGGVNNSGFGSSHGFYGFKAFSHERAVLKHGRLSPLKLLYPPYGKRTERLIDLILRYL